MLIPALLILSTITITVFTARLIVAFMRYRVGTIASLPADLPSVSVCIAARNETHALAQCLERVLKSDYPKLEILVLDDSSSDDTSLIIKSFAGAGVRFVAGKPLPDGWLGKNHAYQTLIDEASGELVLFMDVDTTIRSGTIGRLVAIMTANGSSMISVLPRRDDSYRASAIFGTLRYIWGLLLATRNEPPAASALWLANKDLPDGETHGLNEYKSSVRPEMHLAKRLQKVSRYRYVIGTAGLGVGFEKHLSSQHQTATRLYYPMLGRNLLAVLAASAFLLSLLVPVVVLLMPFFVAVQSPMLGWAAGLTTLLSLLVAYVSRRTYGRIARPIRTLVWPLLVAMEFILLIRSYSTYRSSRVSWKGRSVNVGPQHAEAIRIDS